MKWRTRIGLGVTAAIVWAHQATACACCVEAGERRLQTFEMGQASSRYLQDLTAFGPAWFVTGDCGTDCIVGVLDPQFEYQPQLLVTEDQVAIALSDLDGELRGTLVLDLPDQFTQFMVDTESGLDKLRNDLFLEARMDVLMSGTGDFEMIKMVPAQLILSGRGHHCANAGSFARWGIHVGAEAVQFSLVGGLAVG